MSDTATIAAIRRGLARIRRSRRGDAAVAARCDTIRAACRLYARAPVPDLMIQILINVRRLAASLRPPARRGPA